MTDRRISALTVLGLVTWADGVLHPEEARFFVEAVNGFELPNDDKVKAYREILIPPDIGKLDVSGLDDDDRRWLLLMGYVMASVDGHVAPEEFDMLRRLSDLFGVDWNEARALFRDGDAIRQASAERAAAI